MERMSYIHETNSERLEIYVECDECEKLTKFTELTKVEPRMLICTDCINLADEWLKIW